MEAESAEPVSEGSGISGSAFGYRGYLLLPMGISIHKILHSPCIVPMIAAVKLQVLHLDQ